MNTSKFLKFLNRALYLGSAALLITAIFLSVAVQPAQAGTSTFNNDPKLLLSHIACVNNKVEVHFVVNNLDAGEVPGDVTFKVKINGGSSQTITISSSNHNNGVYHYYWYGTVNGTYDVTTAWVYINGWKLIYMGNPDAYSTQNNQCVSSTATPTKTTVPPTATFTATATSTSVPPTATFTATATSTSVPPTATFTATFTPTVTETSVPDTETPTATATDTQVPPTPTDTEVPPTETPVPPTQGTPQQPTSTPEQPTNTPEQPTSTPEEPTLTPEEPSDTPETPEVTKTRVPPRVLDALTLEVDPFCTVDGQMQWTVINPNSSNFPVEHYTVDGAVRGGFVALPGEHDLTTTSVGTHTVVLFYGESQTVSLTYTIDVCQLPQPQVGNNVLIPVTGADNSGTLTNAMFFGSSTLAGLGLLLSALRRLLK